LAVTLVGIAAYFYWAGNTDAMFATGVLGVCSYFIGMRIQIKNRLPARQRAEADDDIDEEV